MKLNIPLFKIYWDKNDIKAVSNVIKSGENWAIGPKIEEFENKIAKYVGVKYALVFNSGTSVLHSLMLAYGFNPEDEIIVPSFTFIATANAPLFVGAKPVFAEIEDRTFGLDPKDIEKRITSKTKAVMPVHYGGCPCQIEEIEKLAKKYNLILIEDAAESLGAEVSGRKVGAFGDAAMFSFCAPKVITIGEGGAVVTGDKELYEKLKLIRSHGRLETDNYFNAAVHMDYVGLGYNFRLSNILAALGISQLGKINKIIKIRRENASYLTKKLRDLKEIITPQSPENYFHLYQMYTIIIKGGRKIRDALKNHLNKRGIGAKVYFEPVHLTDFYKKSFSYKAGDLPTTEDISDRVLTLPMYPSLGKKEIEYIAKQIKIFFINN